ncbi:MAG: MBL fold metallo-hydrolase [Treponema sp.]|nr:MBL fold metallo-hydrolase [Treponema sp.]
MPINKAPAKFHGPIFFIILFLTAAAAFGQTNALTIHFPELGNKYTGDCIYINYGTMDILIDAGSKQSSAATITAYINRFIQDEKIEYVIATHAHEDHIAGFYSTTTVTGIFESYDIGTIIDFPLTNSNTAVYNNYKNARTKAEGNGAVHYTALQCFNNEDGAQRIYDLDENTKLEILYNYFYENKASNENNYSVCVRIIQNENQYIFTGDLEWEGEYRLAEFYEGTFGESSSAEINSAEGSAAGDNIAGVTASGLGHCVLYKGGHHGSATSANEKLLAAISPEYVCICTCAGSSEYRASPNNVFPAQDFIDRIAPYTDKVYITSYVPDYAGNVVLPYNGNIVFTAQQGEFSIKCSDNDLKLKDTQWFADNRQMPDAWK